MAVNFYSIFLFWTSITSIEHKSMKEEKEIMNVMLSQN
jgi:hypothetical protein